MKKFFYSIFLFFAFLESFPQQFEAFVKYGIKDSNGKIITNAIYDNIYEFDSGVGKIRKNNLYGLLKEDGNEVLPCMYSSIDRLKSGLYLVTKTNDSVVTKYGLVNKKGEFLLQPEYSNIYSLTDNYFSSEKNELFMFSKEDTLFGIVNQAGKIIAPPLFSSLEYLPNDLILVKQKNERGFSEFLFMDTTGRKCNSEVYDEVLYLDTTNILVSKDGKRGILNEKLENRLPIKYEDFGKLGYGVIPAKLNNRWGLVSTNEKTIIKFKYDSLFIIKLFDFTGDVEIVKKGSEVKSIALVAFKAESGRWGLADLSGKIIQKPIFENIEYYQLFQKIKNNPVAIVVEQNSKKGLINSSGDILVPILYDGFQKAEYDQNDFYGIVVSLNEKYGFMNRDAQLITEIKYDEVSYDFDGHGTCQYALVRQKDKWGCVDTKTGKEVISPKYAALSFIGLDSKTGDTNDLYNIQFCKAAREIIIDTISSSEEYENGNSTGKFELIRIIELEGKENYVVEFPKKWALIDIRGNELSPFKYTTTRDFFVEGLLPVGVENKWGFVDESGKEVIPVQYESGNAYLQEYFYEGKTQVRFNDKLIYIDKSGKEINN